MIRAAEQSDVPEIARLWNWMIRDTLATFTTVEKTLTEVADLIALRSGAFWVAERSGMVEGFATFGSFRPGPGYAHTVEHSVIVDPSGHGRGVGRHLMLQLENACKQASHRVMVAAISSANPQAIAFHSALGFETTARMPQVGFKNDQWLDLILMQKILSDAD